MSDHAPGPNPSDPVGVVVADRCLSLADLTHLNRMTTVGHVLPNVAHELNNVLQIIGGISEVVAMNPAMPADVRERIGRIGVQTARATEMLRELVAFTRREGGGVRTVDLRSSVERALALRRFHLARAQVGVQVRGPDGGRVTAKVDPADLLLILLNVLINAEASLAGRQDGRLDIAFERLATTARVVVADNGGGIDARQTDQCFAPFFTTRTPAAGLGLPVAAGLAHSAGGSLRLEPQADGGTAAILELPAG